MERSCSVTISTCAQIIFHMMGDYICASNVYLSVVLVWYLDTRRVPKKLTIVIYELGYNCLSRVIAKKVMFTVQHIVKVGVHIKLDMHVCVAWLNPVPGHG